MFEVFAGQVEHGLLLVIKHWESLPTGTDSEGLGCSHDHRPHPDFP